jgi:L-lactate dehydrogenase complex protein LldF
MPNPFHAQIEKAMSNANLQYALDDNYSRRLNVRLQSYISLPEDVRAMRQRLHDVRSQTIENLQQYLEQFIQAATANGFHVYRAANASEARRIVTDIAHANHVRLVAKSKTMVGEEIDINAALEEAGIEVVETDLGEYIVQIRGERPAHIITPAVHLRRGDVGQTFHEKLGIPYTEDVPTLTAAARDRLRQVFLQGDMGITGVNFGVAENGLLCILTNEGNGRLVSTLPPVCVALMGIERLVPTMDDLASALYLLPRSATGQKLTVYANLIRSARMAEDADGPRERHLVLVDNGRSNIRSSPLQDSLMCVRCGACLNICPAFRELSGHAYVSAQGDPTPYTGPIGSVLSPALFGYSDFGHLARACSLCGACKEACPVDIDLPTMLLRVRAGKLEKDPVVFKASNAPSYLKFGLTLFTWMATSTIRFRSAQRLVGLFSRMYGLIAEWIHLPAFTRWGFSKDFPLPAPQSFSDQWRSFSGSKAQQPLISKIDSVQDKNEAPKTASPLDIPLTEWFGQELMRNGGVFIPCTIDSISEQVLILLHQEGLDALQAWGDPEFPKGLLETLRSHGIQITGSADPNLIGGLTGALGGIAESGTLVLTSGVERPLTASLLTRVHLAILRASTITPRLPQALQWRELIQTSSTVLISGPSRTADIEMTMTIGMHGPGKLYVFCLQDEEGEN